MKGYLLCVCVCLCVRTDRAFLENWTQYKIYKKKHKLLRPSLWRKLSFNSSTVLRGVVSHSTDHSVTAYSLTTVSSVCRGLLGTLHAVFWMPIMLHSFIYFVMTCLNNFEFNPLRFFSVSTAYFFFLSLRTSFVMCFAIYIYIRNKLSNNLDGCINHLWKDHL